MPIPQVFFGDGQDAHPTSFFGDGQDAHPTSFLWDGHLARPKLLWQSCLMNGK